MLTRTQREAVAKKIRSEIKELRETLADFVAQDDCAEDQEALLECIGFNCLAISEFADEAYDAAMEAVN